MQTVYTDSRVFQRQQWQRIWPTHVLTIIGIGQMLLTFAIIGLETWSMLINLKFAFLFIGYFAAVFFTITWISTFTVVCCNQGSHGCAVHALVQNILSTIAASVLLYYNVQFFQEPWMCIWPGKICAELDWSVISGSWWKNYDIDTQNAKLIAVQAQLSCAAVMLALCLVFIVIYIYTTSKVRARMTVIIPQNSIELGPHQQLPPPPALAWPVQPPIWYPAPNK